MEPTNFTSNLSNNMMVIDDFAKKLESAPGATEKTVAQKKVQSGHLCLGVQNGRLLVVDYGTNFITSLIESIKHIFNGVRTGTKEVGKVFVETQKARMQIREFKKEEDKATFDASVKGKIYNVSTTCFNKTYAFCATVLNAIKC